MHIPLHDELSRIAISPFVAHIDQEIHPWRAG